MDPVDQQNQQIDEATKIFSNFSTYIREFPSVFLPQSKWRIRKENNVELKHLEGSSHLQK